MTSHVTDCFFWCKGDFPSKQAVTQSNVLEAMRAKGGAMHSKSARQYDILQQLLVLFFIIYGWMECIAGLGRLIWLDRLKNEEVMGC